MLAPGLASASITGSTVVESGREASGSSVADSDTAEAGSLSTCKMDAEAARALMQDALAAGCCILAQRVNPPWEIRRRGKRTYLLVAVLHVSKSSIVVQRPLMAGLPLDERGAIRMVLDIYCVG